ncbi:MAG: hypothetical protein NWS37_04300 [Flavobacteriaceae bacterium]|nr:hypothetical protein [Flavobacteriaceae bacterium]
MPMSKMKNHFSLQACSLVLIALLGLFACQSPTQNQVEEVQQRIPFVYTSQNNMAFDVCINHQDSLVLMFHTAASGLSLIESSTQNMQSIVWESEDLVESWGGESSSRFSQNNQLSMGSLAWDSIGIWENQRSGPETDGKFGPDLFAHQIIEISNSTKTLIIHDSLPEHATSFQKLPLIDEDGFLFVEARVGFAGSTYPHRFLLHSGYGGGLLLDDAFVQESGLGASLEVISEQELRDSFGNIITTKKAILPQFNIGDTWLEALEVGFFEGEIAQQKISLIGAALLRQFDILIDADRQFIYFKHLGDQEFFGASLVLKGGSSNKP